MVAVVWHQILKRWTRLESTAATDAELTKTLQDPSSERSINE
jgi:hypothetical protein